MVCGSLRHWYRSWGNASPSLPPLPFPSTHTHTSPYLEDIDCCCCCCCYQCPCKASWMKMCPVFALKWKPKGTRNNPHITLTTLNLLAQDRHQYPLAGPKIPANISVYPFFPDSIQFFSDVHSVSIESSGSLNFKACTINVFLCILCCFRIIASALVPLSTVFRVP
jgi:hypothetical protein